MFDRLEMTMSKQPIDKEKRKGYVALKGFFKITGEWGMSAVEQQILLGDLPKATFSKYKELPEVKLDHDQLERISYVMGIHKALMILFSSKERADAWVKKPNEAFAGQSALGVMLEGSIESLAKVRSYVDSYCNFKNE